METQLITSIGATSTGLDAPVVRTPLAVRRVRRTAKTFLVQHAAPSPARRHVEAFIRREFKAHFDAEVREYMPTLAGLYDLDGALRAAVGWRAAGAERLFLESYTHAPIEELVSAQTGVDIARDEIIEVGSLACVDGRAAMEIVLALVPTLIENGFSWVVFTGADTVRNVFRRLSLKPIALCIANKAMLGEKQFEWGSYYDHNPVVMAGKLVDGAAALEGVGGAH